MTDHFTVVIPVHNEGSFIPTVFAELTESVDRLGRRWDLVMVENGSSDDTASVARRLVSAWDGDGTVLSLATPDYGAALREGMRTATGEWIVMFDIDYFSADFVADALAADADIVIASKLAAGSDDRRTLVRRLGTRGFNLALRTLLGSRLGDTHGMKVFRRHAIADLLPQVTHTQDLFDTELVLRAERAGASIVELPVIVEERRQARSSFVRRIPRTVVGLLEMRKGLRP